MGWRTGKALWDAGGEQDGVAVRKDDVSKTTISFSPSPRAGRGVGGWVHPAFVQPQMSYIRKFTPQQLRLAPKSQISEGISCPGREEPLWPFDIATLKYDNCVQSLSNRAVE